MSTTPISLLQRLRQPAPEEAWGQFVGLYTPILFAWTRRLGVPAADAADVVQDVFAVLVQRLPNFTYDPQKSFRGWLWTVLCNKWREQCQRRNDRQGGTATVPEPQVSDHVAAIAQEEYRLYLVKRCLDLIQHEFHPSTWRAFWAVVIEERPVAEVARELKLTPNAVYIAKCRVLGYLRVKLQGLLD